MFCPLKVVQFLTLEVVQFLTLVSLYILPCLGLFGPFLRKTKLIESHVGTSVVQFLAFENVGVIFITDMLFFVFVVFFLDSHLILFYSMLSWHCSNNSNKQESKTKRQRKQEAEKAKQQGNK